MDKEELQQNIALYYSKLSPKMQEVFSSMQWLETLKKISLKHDLDKTQQETLGTETTLVLLGIIHLDEYQKNLSIELNLPKESMDNIITEINESIIKTIHPELLNAFDANTKSDGNKELNFEEELDERFDKLPTKIKNAITETKYHEILYGIAKENALNVEQIGLLETTTTNVILGTIPENKFEDAIKSILKLPNETARIIVDAVNEKILKGIREKIMALDGIVHPTTPNNSAEEKNNTQVLSEHGIEIIPEKLELKKAVHPVRSMSPQDDSSTLVLEKAASNGIHPILAQKLSGSFQTPVVETDHSLNNLTSSNTPTVVPKTDKPQIDPYREIPE